MNQPSPVDLKTIEAKYHTLIASQRTLLFATASKQSMPQISYAPYVQDAKNAFFVFLSELAPHTRNLLENPQASVMFISPEKEAATNLFTRPRVVYECRASEIVSDATDYKTQMQALQEKFGKAFDLVSALPDFHLFVLYPIQGRYIAGFGQTYLIDVSNGSLIPMSPQRGSIK